ncbi:cathepsin E-A-like [Cyprinus carpio]|uniref:Cathepsin E-A-like n=1 Tax=Cyprinus carpio TaxID=7962 RepID=A0A9Q9W8U4_CYPCA|nr:cathepsin E-A-like [Cyprinus carpio]
MGDVMDNSTCERLQYFQITGQDTASFPKQPRRMQTWFTFTEVVMVTFTVCPHYYCRNNGSSFGGELLFGGVDETRFVSPINWIPVTQKGYWQIRLDVVKVQGALSFCYRSTQGCQAVVDTGTSLIGGPARDILLLQQFIGATPTAVGEYLVDCVRISSLPVVSFLINNVEYSLTGEQYIRRETLNNKEICFSGFQAIDVPSPVGPVWILGDVFLSQFYSIYDRGHNQVGLAHLSEKSKISV